ncbi:histidine phosphatase family protein [Luteipulveratus sp. YIM 133132]|uniref:histidine phosphatase family protein n=1 Tax=Luteipulveratus flavus TaxID=3031728 RepID=UPI0023B19D62|nr:histidine phosphatase family protein [Luteipulveratus sp. YIM 133132]MDE9365236.1 histidine phosphatase family protein [Luteipulveratus sp. YIM 133132]
MGSRLLAVAHAPTAATRTARFPLDEDELSPVPELGPLSRRLTCATSGPERRCSTTASVLGVNASGDVAWADLDAGRWSGKSLEEVVATDGAQALERWLGDPAYDGHGGESVAALHARVRGSLDLHKGDGLALVVTSPAVLRALVVVALGAPAEAHRQVSAGPLDGVELSRERPGGSGWSLVRLRPYPQWLQARDLADDRDGGSA